MANSPPNMYELHFLFALMITVITEAFVVLLLFQTCLHSNSRHIPWPNRIAAATIPSIATLPYLWFVLPAFVSTFLLRTILGEIAILLSELVMIRFLAGVTWRNALLLSTAANIASISIGIIIY